MVISCLVCLDDPAAVEIVARDPVLEVGSPRTNALISGCLQECISTHTKCPRLRNNLPLPTRVIDCSNPDKPRLYESRGSISAPYTALSYVWGAEQPNRTVLSNINAYVTQGIHHSLIPRTVADAIKVTASLGLRYLWVDSFCIIQDSKSDKRAEIMQMRKIFSNAYLTIVAASAASAFTGFLQDRAPTAPPSPRIPYWCRDGSLGTVSLMKPDTPASIREHVDHRAWCYEEHLLSPRKIIYTTRTVQYHCQSSTQAIGGALPQSSDMMPLPNMLFRPDVEIPAMITNLTRPQRKELRWSWVYIVSEYSRRSVTKPKDKLTALSGVAEQLNRIWDSYLETDYAAIEGATRSRGTRYLAGLWEHFLPRELLWHLAVIEDDKAYPKPRPIRYVAPSWSWASVDGGVRCGEGLCGPFLPANTMHSLQNRLKIQSCEVITCYVTPEDDRLPYGRVTSGVLKLRVPTMIPTTWNPGNPLDYTRRTARIYAPKGGSSAGVFMFSEEMDSTVAGNSSMVHICDVIPDSTEEVEGQVWLLLVMWNRTPGDVYAAGLLVSGARDGSQFRRIGFWNTPELEVSLGDWESEEGLYIDQSDEKKLEWLDWYGLETATQIIELI